MRHYSQVSVRQSGTSNNLDCHSWSLPLAWRLFFREIGVVQLVVQLKNYQPKRQAQKWAKMKICQGKGHCALTLVQTFETDLSAHFASGNFCNWIGARQHSDLGIFPPRRMSNVNTPWSLISASLVAVTARCYQVAKCETKGYSTGKLKHSCTYVVEK